MTLREMLKEPSSSLTFVRKGDRSNSSLGVNGLMTQECSWVSKEAPNNKTGVRTYSLVSIRADIARKAFGDNLKGIRFQFALERQAEAFYIFADPDGFQPQTANTKLTVRLNSKLLPMGEVDRLLSPSVSVVTIDGMSGVRIDLRGHPIKWGE